LSSSRALRRTRSRAGRPALPGAVTANSCSSGARIRVSGVRNSWLTLARKSLLAWLAASAWSRAWISSPSSWRRCTISACSSRLALVSWRARRRFSLCDQSRPANSRLTSRPANRTSSGFWLLISASKAGSELKRRVQGRPLTSSHVWLAKRGAVAGSAIRPCSLSYSSCAPFAASPSKTCSRTFGRVRLPRMPCIRSFMRNGL